MAKPSMMEMKKPPPLQALGKSGREDEPEPEIGGDNDFDDADDEMESDVSNPRTVSGDMLGFVPSTHRCGACQHQKDGMCSWMEEPVEDQDGCLRGFEPRGTEGMAA